MTPATRTLLLGALAVAAAGAGVAAGAWFARAERDTVLSATVLDTPRPLPDFTLVDERGATITRTDLEGRWTFLFFGFTHCPDVCPMTLQVLAATLRALDDLPQDRRPAARFVSVDPQRDTPAQLAGYLAPFHEDIRGLTGDEGALAAFARALGIAYARVERPDGEDYTMDHTAALLLLDPQARLVAVFTPPHDARALAADVRVILKRPPA